MTYRFDPGLSSAIGSTDATPISTTDQPGPLDAQTLALMHRYWQAANFLTVGQIYLQSNPLLREPLAVEHIKPRLLGHWGTSPGLNLIYLHLNRLIRERDVNMIFLAGPGHGGPAVLANVYLEGTYSEIYPNVSRDVAGLTRLFRQFSTPGGVPSHVSVPTPGSIHEGGELGYVLSHAFGAAFDNPGLIVAAVVGDGEAETAPLAGSWKSVNFLNPVRDGAVLPILHLNGYKIAGPSVLARLPERELRSWLEGEGYDVRIVGGSDPVQVHQAFAAALDQSHDRIQAIQGEARRTGFTERPRWPLIVLRTPKGWTGPSEVGGKPVEGTFRSHQVPLSSVRTTPGQLEQLEHWLGRYEPAQQFDASGRLVPELQALAPRGDRRMGSNPHANGGRVLQPLRLRPFEGYAAQVPQPGQVRGESPRHLGRLLRDIFVDNADRANFRLMSPDETSSNRLGEVFEVENRCFVGRTLGIDDHVRGDGRVMEVLSEHLCEGWLEGYLLTGRHGLFATYEAFAMVSSSMTVQHTKWLQEGRHLDWRAPIASLNILLTSTCWRNDHNGFSHQGPGLIDVMLSKRGTVARIYMPPDANSLLSVADHCLRSRNYVNLIVIDKQPQLQWLDIETAKTQCACGASIWEWASIDDGRNPDVVLTCAGDVPTLEIAAAAWWLRHHVPELRVRVVNVVDLMTLFPPDVHPHGMPQKRFTELFTADRPVVFAFHGYQRAIHELVHGRPGADRFHVRGFNEQGTTTTPFSMVAMNGMSRYHLASLALERATRLGDRGAPLIERCRQALVLADAHARDHFEDPPEVAAWTWNSPPDTRF
jgi:xylulose-5-phosphate/fructose-6-phosphate phosphoketolase